MMNYGGDRSALTAASSQLERDRTESIPRRPDSFALRCHSGTSSFEGTETAERRI